MNMRDVRRYSVNQGVVEGLPFPQCEMVLAFQFDALVKENHRLVAELREARDAPYSKTDQQAGIDYAARMAKDRLNATGIAVDRVAVGCAFEAGADWARRVGAAQAEAAEVRMERAG